MRLVQLERSDGRRVVAFVDGERLRLASESSAYALISRALDSEQPLESVVQDTGESISYEEVYAGASDWRLLPSFDHPGEPARCLVSGTGLTHRASADNRNAMHEAAQTQMTDSMRMYAWGVEGGRPAQGAIGAQPEWFYKGCGTILRGCGDPLDVPAFGGDGGEEPEIAGVYLIDQDGLPRRAGFTVANEFSDHIMEKQNYLYLAPSKLRTCSIGPELVTAAPFGDVRGTVRVLRDGKELWRKDIASGEDNMCHSLANLEHHHFKYEAHRRPGDVHIHFFGASSFSFGAGVKLEEGDVMEVAFDGFGKPLRNTLRVSREPQRLMRVQPLPQRRDSAAL